MELSFSNIVLIILVAAAVLGRSQYRRVLKEMNMEELQKIEKIAGPAQKIQYSAIGIILLVVLVPEIPLFQKQMSFETIRLISMVLGLSVTLAGIFVGLPLLFFHLRRSDLSSRFIGVYLFDRGVFLLLLLLLVTVIYREPLTRLVGFL